MSENSFNRDEKSTLYYIDDETGMVIHQNPSWAPHVGNNGKEDSIGRTFEAMVAGWGDREEFLDSIKKCWVRVERKGFFRRLILGKWYYQGYRYPTYEKLPLKGLSRDHTIYTVLAYIEAGKSEKEIWEFVKRLRYRISDFAKMTPDMWLWLRAVSGRRFWRWLYYIVDYYVYKLTFWYHLKVEKFSGIGPHYEEHHDEFKRMSNSDKPKIVEQINKILYPVYALIIASWQVQALPEGKWKKKLQKLKWSVIPKYNWLIQLVNEDPNGPTEEQVMSYAPMRGNRWTGVCNKWWNDRNLRKIKEGSKESKFNRLDVDYLRAVYKRFGIN
jgi:hypothetical protein